MATTDPRELTVIIVNFNAGDRLKKCVAHLKAQSAPGFKVIIFDNASTDSSLNEIALEGINADIIRHAENIGFAAANNVAAAAATSRWIALLNPDAYAAPDWVERLLAGVDRHPDVKVFGSLQLDAEDPATLDGAGDVVTPFGVYYRGGFGSSREYAPARDMSCFAVCAAASLYDRELFLSLGGLDERFFCYGEDVDFSFRVRNAGGECVQLHDAVVHHEGSGVTGRRSDFTTYYGTRNRIWLTYKNLPAPFYVLTFPLRLIADFALFAKALLAGGGKSYIRGVVDGYGGLAQFRGDRAAIDRSRRDSRARIVSRLTWSPFKLLTRAVDLRELR